MNAYMRITVTVANRAARELANIARQTGVVGTQAGKAQITLRGLFGRESLSRMEKFGKNLQWTGRQLEYRFTLPLLLAAGAAVKFAMSHEEAMVRVRKVYGDASMSMAEVNAEVDALEKAFTSLSNIFGVAKNEIGDIAETWARSGSGGAGLAKNVRTTLEAMILGGMDAESTTRSLIVVMQAYRLSAEELTEALAMLNVIDNETTASFQDATTVIAEAGSVARQSGVDIQHLAAMAAALVPVAGTASSVGNSLKTLMARVMAPTQQAADAFERLGVNVAGATWQNSNFTERLELLAGGYDKLGQAQKLQWARDVAQLRQINRLVELLDDMTSSQSRYRAALEATGDAQANMATYNREIGMFLSSSPQAFKIMTTQLQNAMAEIIVPMLPVILSALQEVVRLVRWFADLDPAIQKAVMAGLMFIAVIGPLAAQVGAVISLVAVLGKGLIGLGAALTLNGRLTQFFTSNIGALARAPWTKLLDTFGAIARASYRMAVQFLITAKAAMVKFSASVLAFLGPKALIIAAAVAIAGVLMWLFRDQVGDAIGWIGKHFAMIPRILGKVYTWMVRNTVDAFAALPRAIVASMETVVKIVKNAALTVYKWMSYLNPFARHSPSLVEQVDAGVAYIASRYASLSNVANVFRQSASDLRAFMSVTERARAAMRGAELAEQRGEILKVAPNAGRAFDAVTGSLGPLNAELAKIQVEIDMQQRIVDKWAAALRTAEEALRGPERELRKLQKASTALRDELTDAQDLLSKLSNTPLIGMRRMSDVMFENEMAQKALRLEILRLEEAGHTVDDLKSRMAKLGGEIELLRGERSDLRLAGAGSDILGALDQQIAELEQARDTLAVAAGGTDPTEHLRKQLEKLERQGQILDLEHSITFDPLLRQIEQVLDTSKEMDFATLIEAIRVQQKEVARLDEIWGRADKATKAQEEMVDKLREKRDLIRDSYDDEARMLQDLEDGYRGVEDQIKRVEDAISSLISAIKSSGMGSDEMFPGDFEIPGGTGMLGHEGGLDDINALAEQWLAESMAMFDDFSLFGGIGEAWSKFWKGLREAPGKFFGWLGDKFALNPVIKQGWDNTWRWVGDRLDSAGGFITRTASSIWDRLPNGLDLNGGKILDFFGSLPGRIGDRLGDLREAVRPAFDGLVSFIGSLPERALEALGGVGRFMATIGGWFITGLTELPMYIGFAVGAVVAAIVRIPLEILKGLWELGNWLWDEWLWPVIEKLPGLLSGAVGGVLRFFADLPGAIIDKIGDFGAFMWRNVFEKAFNFFTQQLPSMASDLLGWFASLPGQIVDEIGDLGGFVWENVFVKAFNFFTQQLPVIVVETLAWFAALPGRILDEAAGLAGLMWGLGERAMSVAWGLLGGLMSGVVAVMSWIAGLPQRILNAVGHLGMLLWNAGWDVMSGLKRGLESGWNAMSGWVSGIGSKVSSVFSRALGIFSPSRVFMGIGGDVMDGLAIGLARGWSDVDSLLASRALGMATQFASMASTDDLASGTVPSSGMVVPLKANGGTTNHFHGATFEFPNVRNGDDAEDFLRNLEALAS